MPTFEFEATDPKGKKVNKTIEAADKKEAVTKVRAMGLFPSKVKESGTSGKSGRQPAGGGAKGKKKQFVIGGVSAYQLTQFTVQLSTLQDAGLPIVRSIKILEGQLKPCKLKFQLMEVAEEVESGSTFSEALNKHPKTFNKLYVSMVRAGEMGGVLDTILQRLAVFMEKSQKLKKKLIGAMIYPIVVIVVAVGILAFIMTSVVPVFQKMFKEQGLTLPAPTQALMSLADFMKVYWWTLPGLPVLVVVLYKVINSSPKGQFIIDQLKLKVPILGTVVRKSTIARFTRTLGTLIASGVPILDALTIVKDALGNAVVAKAVDDTHGSIREGESIAGPLSKSGIFDDIVINMIDVGEETGELDKMMMKIADNYEDDVDIAVESMTSVIEPLLIVGMGGAVGFIVVALFLPLVDLIQGMGSK